MLNFEEINPYYKKVTLIGMMGTGKSKFGRQIANILNLRIVNFVCRVRLFAIRKISSTFQASLLR